MPEREITHLVPPRDMADGEPPRVRIRVGDTVRRTSYAWSPAVVDLLQHVEHEGFDGAPRALGFDDQGREVLTFIEGEVARGVEFIPDEGGRFDLRLPDFVWRDEVLVHLGALLRAYHDAAATFSWADREWCYEARQPVETICHNEVFPSNTVFRDGLPVALIDWDTAAPGPRAWDLGWAAWRWVPFFRDEKCLSDGAPDRRREQGTPLPTAARRLRHRARPQHRPRGDRTSTPLSRTAVAVRGAGFRVGGRARAPRLLRRGRARDRLGRGTRGRPRRVLSLP